MKYIVQVRPFLHLHNEADVIIPVFDSNDINRLVRWFKHNCLDTKVHGLDDEDNDVNLAAADKLVMTLADLFASGEAVLQTAIQNGERMRRSARRAHANDLRWTPLNHAINN